MPGHDIELLIREMKERLTSAPTGEQALEALFNLFAALFAYFEAQHLQEYFVTQLDEDLLSWIVSLQAIADARFPLKAHSVFEDGDIIQEIVADVWQEGRLLMQDSHLLNPKGNCGLIRMEFQAGCSKLPLHIHPLSDRILVILKGAGYGHYSNQGLDKLEAGNIHSIPVKAGTVIFFNRGLVHTFSTGPQPLTTLTYHHPFIEFEDHLSYEKALDWYPEQAGG
jgi:quercetin dioxygenase-like cupin family protein